MNDRRRLPEESRLQVGRRLAPVAEAHPDDGCWKTVRLGDHIDSCLGKMLDAAKNRGELRPYLANKNVRWGSFDTSDLALMRFEDDEQDRYGLEAGDLVVCEGGEPGRCAIWRGQIPDMKIQKALHRIRGKGRLDVRYLHYWFMAAGRSGHLEPHFTGTTIKHLTARSLNDLQVRLPPKPEQVAIARILGALDERIEVNRRMNETLEQMARALFKSWFVDFDPVRAKMEAHDTGLPPSTAALFPDQLADDGIPFGWQISTIGEHVLNFDSRRRPVSRARRADMQGPFPYHGAAGVLDQVNDYLFDGVFLLLGEDGSVVRESGLAVTQYVSGQFWVNNHAHVLQGKGAVSTEQVYLHFSFEPISPFVTGAVQPKLSQRRMNQVPFVYAGEALCRAFAQAVGGLFARRRKNAMVSNTLAALRDLLLPKLISGDIRVADVERTIGVIA